MFVNPVVFTCTPERAKKNSGVIFFPPCFLVFLFSPPKENQITPVHERHLTSGRCKLQRKTYNGALGDCSVFIFISTEIKSATGTEINNVSYLKK